MSMLDVMSGLPAGVAAKFELYGVVPGVELRPVRAVPARPLSEFEILDGARRLVPSLRPAGLRTVAVLTPRTPWVDGVGWLDFETVEFYRAGDAPLAAVGTFHTDPEFPPSVRLTLAQPPAGAGLLVTVRAQGMAVGPNFPGYFGVEGPGVDAVFVDSGTPTTFTFFVPPGGNGPGEIRVTTEPDRIRLWAFFDCTITRL